MFNRKRIYSFDFLLALKTHVHICGLSKSKQNHFAQLMASFSIHHAQLLVLFSITSVHRTLRERVARESSRLSRECSYKIILSQIKAVVKLKLIV